MLSPTSHSLSCIVALTVACFTSGCGSAQSSERIVARGAGDADPASPARSTGAGVPASGSGAAVLVDVAGLVRRPGVYRLAVGARVHEAIAAAGGARRGADLTALNRAAPLVDGQQVLVGAPAKDAAEGSSAATGAGTVSINAADVAALDALPGIGPVTAERIVADRGASGPFQSVDELDRVPGIGPATIEPLRPHVTT